MYMYIHSFKYYVLPPNSISDELYSVVMASQPGQWNPYKFTTHGQIFSYIHSLCNNILPILKHINLF